MPLNKSCSMPSFLRKHIEEIIPLSDEEFERIELDFQLLNFARSEILISPQQPVTAVYLVKTGMLKSWLPTTEGKQYILQFAWENWWISDFNAFFKIGISSLTVQALQASSVYQLSLKSFEQLAQDIPAMEHFFRIKSNLGYAALQNRIISLLSKSAKERFEELNDQYPELLQFLPKNEIANYLGVSRETLSRLYRK